MKALYLIVLITAFFACKEDKSSEPEIDYLIFGHFYGYCMGEHCVETYKLTSEKLYEDTLDRYFHDEFSFQELTDREYNVALGLGLPSDIPEEIRELEEGIIGCPDCADQGGIFIRISRNGTVRSWRFDNDLTNVPEFMVEYLERIKIAIDQINSDQ